MANMTIINVDHALSLFSERKKKVNKNLKKKIVSDSVQLLKFYLVVAIDSKRIIPKMVIH